MEVWIERKTKAGPNVRRKREDWYRKRIWNEEEYEMFSKKLDTERLGKKDIGKKWDEMETRIKKTLKEMRMS